MSVPVKLIGFVALLAAVFAIAVGVGNAVGPIDTAEPQDAHAGNEQAEDSTGHDAGHEGTGEQGGDEQSRDEPQLLPGGLMVAQDGYAFALADSTVRPGRQRPIQFTIEGPDGHAVTAYDVEHDKRLHLIAVRRDMTGYQHVHPRLDPSGTWLARVDLEPGTWRLFADFTPAGGDPLTLGTDLFVSGDAEPVGASDVTRLATMGDYRVEVSGDLVAGTESDLTLTVTRDGRPVTDLQPYLAAYGHLVALRAGDLAYLHVHPDGAPGDGTTEAGPDVVFHAEVPSAGRYHLYFDFRHQGVVRTASFVVTAAGPTEEHS